MKKGIIGAIIAAGLLLLASCVPEDVPGPNNLSEGVLTASPIVVPTCTPMVSETPEPAITEPAVTEPADSTATPTVAVEPTEEPEPTPTEMPEVTEVPEPTVEPQETVTPSPEPTMEPQETVTPSPEPTMEPQETVTPSPEPTEIPQETLTPTPSPTPMFDSDSLVNNGWQKTVSIDEKYCIVFPEQFRESTVEKTNKELIVRYTCPEDEAMEFLVSYTMQKTLEETVQEILEAEEILSEGVPEEKRVMLQWQKDGMIYRAALLEEQYSKNLLGSAFGEEEWITGVMQVVFSYPEERQAEYETAEFSYYVEDNREE